ncbi:carbohydrate kinase family protein [Ornithinimicrobium pratense]|uniref:Carbohydrate kinase n=1 Tax=Ornithinimicrobium pratense TaxID=2593973 RepID=A0A5J6V836_9MICO|nr:carbohydrate kinase [Ornithinimicrobium pratense]QFG69286.1 carbohydrate kinase [Ornithinimicrobium pratense]
MSQRLDPVVLTVGEALTDVVVSPDGRRAEHVGGSPANVAVGLAALGHPSRLTAYLADDDRGRRLRAHLEGYGVQLTEGSLAAERTSSATAHLDAEGVATYDFDLAWRLGEQDLGGVGHLHTGSLAATVEPGGSAVVDLMAQARMAGATVSYDPNCRPTLMGRPDDARQRIEECLGRSDVVKASLEDVEWLYADAPVLDVAREWGRLSPLLVVVTRGGEGPLAHLSASGATVELPAQQVEVVDTVGAGDSFMAGLLSGLLDTGLLGGSEARERLRRATAQDLEPALRRAVATASWTVGRAGAAAPSRADLH